MGVSGAGKTTVGELLARELARPFIDADDLHDAEMKGQMARGIPLSDADREPWLDRVGRAIAEADPAVPVIACSALKVAYRDRIRAHAPQVSFVELVGAPGVILDRLRTRTHAYMPPELLDSQLETLEPLTEREAGIRIDIGGDAPADIVQRIRAWMPGALPPATAPLRG
ncbi:gluconokinase [Leucobacter zeae]|nr:gluconokinase [Leucobacter zeae]